MNQALTIIIPCYNDRRFLYPTIENILATGPDKDYRIIIVDDGNAPALEQRKFNSPIQIDWLRMAERHGCAACRMMGFSAAKSDFVLFCDSHMIFPPDWFKTWQLYNQQENEVLTGTYAGLDFNPKTNEISREAKLCQGAKLHLWLKENGNLKVFEPKPCKPDPKADRLIKRNTMLGASYFVPSKLFRSIDGFRYLQYWGGDEELLALKIYRTGGNIGVMRDLTISHINTDSLYSGAGRTGKEWLLYNKLVVGFLTLDDSDWEIMFEFVKAHNPVSMGIELFNSYYPALNLSRNRLRDKYTKSIEQFCAEFDVIGFDDLGACQFD